MADTITLTIDGETIRVPAGTTVAAAVWNRGTVGFRRSPGGHARAPVCGMGTCYECRVTIDGHADQRSCQQPCREGMKVVTGDAA